MGEYDLPQIDDSDEGPFVDELAAWPNCTVPDCENKACLWAGTGRCHPCSERLVGQAEMERRYAETRGPDGEWNGKFAQPAC